MESLKYTEILQLNKALVGTITSKPYEIGVLSNVTVNSFKEVLEYSCRLNQIEPKVEIGNFDNIVQDSAVLKNKDLIIIFYDVLNPLMQKEREAKVQIYPISTRWYETGNPFDYFTATQQALTHADQELFTFINQYDDSLFVQNEKTMSLVSKSQNLNFKNLAGTNVISKTAPILENQNFTDMIVFEDEILNLNYFS